MNIGIIGSGKIVPTFIETSKMIRGFKLCAIFGRNEERLKTLKDKYDIGYYTTDYEDILNDRNIDVVYIALPNFRHYEYGKKALLHDKHVIMEKPFTHSYETAKELVDIARRRKLIIFEAITTLYLPNFKKIKENINSIGKIRVVDLNFSQYSSRYDNFRKGIITPVFDYRECGGALMDLGVYNIHFAVGLFGKPLDVSYYPNIQRRIDTSGLLVLRYKDFVVSAINAKDSRGPTYINIEGEDGLICSDDGSNTIRRVNIGNKEYREKKELIHYYELKEFYRLYREKDLKKAREYNRETLIVSEILDRGLGYDHSK